MLAQKKKKCTSKKPKRAAYIKYKLAMKGYKIVDIARDLNITDNAVTLSLYGLSKITRVDEWLKEHIGIEV